MEAELKFEMSRTELRILGKILDRMESIFAESGREFNRLAFGMDIEAAHCNGCPLNLLGLLDASDSDFKHDVMGIRQNLNRETGKLQNLFMPRFADRDTIAA